MAQSWRHPSYISGMIFSLAVLISCGWLVMSRPWAGQAEPPNGQEQGEKSASDKKPARDQFAADRDDALFDASRAMGYLKDICKIGPRISGSDGMKKQQELLKKHFESLGGKVEMQKFTAQQRSQPRPVDMANMMVSWYPDRQRRVILCSHYDTRPIADQEPDRRKWHEPFLSANDGGSGVALLMELAHQMKDFKTEVGVDFVLFDGEEYIFDPEPGHDKYFFGSEHFASAYAKEKRKKEYLGAVLLDMIAGKNPSFPVEQNSWEMASSLVDQLWKIAAAQGCVLFKAQEGPKVLDDHLALNGKGIPTVDIIDFDYPHWHRLSDLPDNCSGDSMYQVARVLTTWLRQVK
jgi:glutaminyl-peptide cyclotransferase